MSKVDILEKLSMANEITLTVKGRKSGRDIPRPVWLAYEGNTLYLLPVQGSNTNWYKNLLAGSMMKISIDGIEIHATGKPITDGDIVENIVEKFRNKYGEGDIKKYYTKFDVAVKVPL